MIDANESFSYLYSRCNTREVIVGEMERTDTISQVTSSSVLLCLRRLNRGRRTSINSALVLQIIPQ